MKWLQTLIIFTVIITPVWSLAATKKTTNKPVIKMKKAHDFLSYLTSLGIVEINSKLPCRNGKFIPDTTTYSYERCISTFKANYSCPNKSQQLTAMTHIDWRYVSEIKQSGYDQSGKEINIAGNIRISNLEHPDNQDERAQLIKETIIEFDSPQTTKRALNAFILLRKRCDTSKDYPF